MTRFERWSVLLTTAATVLTGVGYFWAKYLVRSPDPWAVINHPLQPWLLKAHILVAPLLVFAVGLIALRHIWRHLRSGNRGGRRSGLAMALGFGPMVVSGYLVQAVTAPGWLQALAIAHIVLGVVYAIGFVIHQVVLARSQAGQVEGAAESGARGEAADVESGRGASPVGADAQGGIVSRRSAAQRASARDRS